jgi:phytoene synthase
LAVGTDLDLVRLYWPDELRPAFDALMAIDEAMAEVVASSTQPALGAIRLAWWREALQRLDLAPPPAEPRLEAAARELLARGIKGNEIAAIEEGWATLLDETPDMRRVAQRGQRLFAMAARLLGSSHDKLSAAGRLFAVTDAARRGYFQLGRSEEGVVMRFPADLRPVTALAALAARDVRRGGPPFELQAAPGRAWTLIKHRVTGRIR